MSPDACVHFAKLQGQTVKMGSLHPKTPSCSGAFHGTGSTSESPSLAFAFSKAPVRAKPQFPKKAAQISTACPEGCQRTDKLNEVLMQCSLGSSFLPL